MSSGLSATDELLEKQKREHREMQKQSSSKKPSDFLMNMPLEKEQAETGEETIDLNYRLICKDCKKIPSNVVENYKAGDYVCGDCGLVFPMRIIDMSTEWRNFSNDTGAAVDDPSRVGAAENPLLEGVVDQLSTNISGMDGRTGQSQALQKAQIRASGAVKGDRDLMQSFREIAVITENHGLPRTVADTAKQLYKMVFDKDVAKGKPNMGLIGACLVIACRNSNVSRPFKDICEWTGVKLTTLSKCFKAIVPLVDKRMNLSPDEFVARFCSYLNLAPGVQTTAEEIVKNTTRLGVLAGKNSLSVVSAAILMACYLMGVEKNEKEIANVTNISPQTVKNAYRELYQARHQVTAGITAKVLVDDIENPLTSL